MPLARMHILNWNPKAGAINLFLYLPTNLKIAQFLKGKSSFRLQREFKDLQKRYWGQHLWTRGYFCATVGAVNEEIIKKYIENQSDDEGEFKVWDKDETKVDQTEKPT